jgi:diaminopimelate decarboxylase
MVHSTIFSLITMYQRSTYWIMMSLKKSTCPPFFRPTCDSMDVICKHVMLPELKVGDWQKRRDFFANQQKNTKYILPT